MKLASLQGNYRADNGLTMDAAAVREAPVLGLVRWTAGPGGVPCGHREQSEERPLRRARLPLSRFGMGADRGSWEAHVECSGSVRVCISWECVHNFSLAGANATSIESPEGCGPRITFPSKWSKVSLKVRRATSTLLVLTLPHTHTLSSLHRPPESYRPVTSAPTLYYKPYSHDAPVGHILPYRYRLLCVSGPHLIDAPRRPAALRGDPGPGFLSAHLYFLRILFPGLSTPGSG